MYSNVCYTLLFQFTFKTIIKMVPRIVQDASSDREFRAISVEMIPGF